MGLAAVAAGLASCSSGRNLQDWEARAGTPWTLPGRVVPVDLQAVAATALTVDAITVELWSAHSASLGPSLHVDTPARTTYHEKQFETRVTLREPLAVGQALRIRVGVRIPPDAPVRRRQGSDQVVYFLRVDVDIPWRPDCYQGWHFVDVLDRLPPRRADEEVLVSPASQDLAGLEVTCPYCGEPPGTRALVSCVACETLHHRDCWREAEACTTFACGEARARDVLLVRPGAG